MNTKRCLLRKKQLNLSKNKAKFCLRSQRTIFLRVGIARKEDDGGFEWLHWTTMSLIASDPEFDLEVQPNRKAGFSFILSCM